MSEFSIIQKGIDICGAQHDSTVLAVEDDGAIVRVPPGYELCVSIDSMAVGTHFFKGLSAELAAHKLLAVNLSDMAAMGARPKWTVFSFCMPEFDQDYVDRFTKTFSAVAKRYGVQIVGGDINQAESEIYTLSIMGLLPEGESLRRSGAQPGDRVFCSGFIGDAALALTRLNSEQELSDEVFAEVLHALHMPIPQVTLGQRLLGKASACIDMSDGLVGDASNLARCSDVSIEIDINKLPLSPAYKRYMQQGGFIRYAVAGGDDYQLLFTVSEEHLDSMSTISKDLDVPLTEIGVVIEKGDKGVYLTQDGNETNIRPKGYQHFA